MTITVKKFNERHKKFENKVSDDTYESLENLNNIISGQDQQLLQSKFLEKIFKYDRAPKRKMKIALIYIKWCSIIESLLMEYENDNDELVKIIIDYYIESNLMKEMNQFGLGWYYDVKFKKNKATLYSVSYGSESNWATWLLDNNIKDNHLKENGVQLIFKACKEHINRGGQINLKSLSKGFGVDLFKYMQLDDSFNAHLYIIKDAPINFIETNNNKIPLQEYLQSEYVFNPENEPQFCLDFSHPRNKKSNNYNKWSKEFLKDEVYISQAEIQEKRESYNMDGNLYDIILLEWLKQDRKQAGETAISSRVSPIADKEVVVSDTLWEIEEYHSAMKEETIKSKKCYHFTFDKTEYYQLIYFYFKMYAEKKSKKRFTENYDVIMDLEIENLLKVLTRLNKEQEEFENLDKIQIEDEELIEKEKNYKNNQFLIKFYIAYEAFLKEISIDDVSPKIQLALSFIDWETEEINEEWSLDNMYILKNAIEENLLLNLYKTICKNVVVKGA